MPNVDLSLSTQGLWIKIQLGNAKHVPVKYVIPELCLNWAAKQEDLNNKGLVDKEIANVALDRRKTKDPEKLKCMGGPFTMSSRLMST